MAPPTLDTSDLQLITFDCYGTLVDWQTGIRGVLQGHLEQAGLTWQDEHFDRYLEIEARQQCEMYRSYREILNSAEREFVESAGVSPPPAPALARCLPDWQPFEDTPEALRRLQGRYRLGVLSNIDRDLFAGTARRLGVDFDVLITAQDVRYYKPGTAHFERLVADTGLQPRQILHAAESLYHDIRPCQDLGLPCVWINRRGQTFPEHARPVVQFPDLRSLADDLLDTRERQALGDPRT